MTRFEHYKEIQKFKAVKDYDGMIVAAKNALAEYDNFVFRHYLHYAQAHYVNAKLKSDVVKQLEANKDYLSLQMVYQKLLMIFPESKKLRSLLSDVHKMLDEQSKLQKAAYFNEAEAKINELIKTQTYDEALEHCREVLNYDSSNKRFQNLESKINALRDSQIENSLDEYFNKTIPELRTQFLASKDTFVSV